MGRPTKLNAEIEATILAAVADGLPWQLCADLVGITRQTLHNWRKWGEAGTEPYAAFFDAMKEAEAKAVQQSIADIRRRESGWQASAWYLERRAPDFFGRDRVEPRDETPRSKPEAQRMLVKAAEALGMSVPEEWAAMLEADE